MRTDEEKVFLIKVGAKIRALRESLDLSQESLGNEINISKNQVGRIERAQHATSIAILFKLAYFFKIDIKSFFE